MAHSTEGRVLYVTSYHILTFPCSISGFALETRRFRDAGLSLVHVTRMLRMNTQSAS